MTNNCFICYEEADIPHILPCSHIFCYICILRHLSDNTDCPVCRAGSFSSAELKTDCKKFSSIKNTLLVFKKNRNNYIKVLKEYKINTKGDDLVVLQLKYKELVNQLMVDQYRDKPTDLEEIKRIIDLKYSGLVRVKKKNFEKIYSTLLKIKNKNLNNKKNLIEKK